MIFINSKDLPSTTIIQKKDKYIGVQGSMNAIERIFCVPKIFHNIDLTNPQISSILMVKPVVQTEDIYPNLLIKLSESEIDNLPENEKTYLTSEKIENSVFYKWTVNARDTFKSGNIGVNIHFIDTNNNLMLKTWVGEFIVSEDVGTYEANIASIDIWTASIAEASKAAQSSIEAAGLVYEMIENFNIDLTKKADLDETGKIPLSQLPETGTTELDLINIENRLDVIESELPLKADLGNNGKILSSQLPEAFIYKLDSIEERLKELELTIDNLENGLPNEYEKAIYVSSIGDSYIDTGITPNQSTRVKAHIERTPIVGEDHQAVFLFGARASSRNKAYGVRLRQVDYGYSIQTNAINNLGDIDFNGNQFFINEELSMTLDAEVFNTGYNIYIFANNNGGSPLNISPGTNINYFQIINNGQIVRDFIPCRNKLTGTYALYDKISKEIFMSKTATQLTGYVE